MPHGGLGLSQTNYCRAASLLGSYCANLAALVSAHQSIGVPQPLILFGSEEQKARFLPRVAKGEISAFALTETGVQLEVTKLETPAPARRSAETVDPTAHQDEAEPAERDVGLPLLEVRRRVGAVEGGGPRYPPTGPRRSRSPT